MIEVLRNEYRIIIQHLDMEGNRYIPSSIIANIIGVSTKTVAEYLKEIDAIIIKYGAKIESKTGSGYRLTILDGDKYQEFKNDVVISMHHELDQMERCSHFVIREFLSKPHLKTDFFEHFLYTTRSTVNRYYKEANRLIKKFNLSIVAQSSKGNKIVGLEHDIRCCINYEIFYYQHAAIIGEKSFPNLYINQVVSNQIETVIGTTLQKYHFSFLDERAVMELATALYIAHVRNSHENQLSYDEETIDRFAKRNSYYLAKNINDTLVNELQLNLTENDVLFITIFIVANRTFLTKDDFPVSEGYVSCNQLAMELIKYLVQENRFQTIGQDEKLIDSLSLNLTQILTQSEFHLYKAHHSDYRTKSLQSDLMATQIAAYLLRKYKFLLTIGQINYLSIIIYPVFGRYSFDSRKGKALVMSRVNKFVALGMKERLERNFGRQFSSIEICNLYEFKTMDLTSYNYVFTSYAKSELPVIPEQMLYINVDTFFDTREKHEIRNQLIKKNIKSSGNYLNQFKTMTILKGIKAKNKEAVFDIIAANTDHEGVSNETVVKSIKAYDNLNNFTCQFSTVFVTPLYAVRKDPKITVLVLDKTIKWNENKVQIVVYWDRGDDEKYSSYFENESLPKLIYRVFTRHEVLLALVQHKDLEMVDDVLKEIHENIIENGSSFR